MSKRWPNVKIGEVVRQERHQVGSFNGDGLPVLGVTNTEGVTYTGVEASDDKSKYFRLRPGRFVFNPYRINVGSIGVSSATQDGICSPAYVVFAPTERIDPAFLWFFLKSARGNQLINFHGNRGSVRSALRFDDMAEVEIPLPPVAEQRRLVARIETFDAQIQEAVTLRRRAIEETEALTGRFATQILDDILPTARLEDVCPIVTDGTHQTPRYTDNGAIFLSAKNVKPFRFMPQEHRKVSIEDFRHYTANYKPRHGDVLLTRVGAGIGEAAVIDQDIEFAIYVSIALIRTDSRRLLPQFLVHWLNSPAGRASSHRETLGRGTSQGNLNLKLLRGFTIPVPPLAEQHRIVAELDSLRTEVDALKHLQAETAAELDALLPSILDRAFGAEL